MGLVFFVLSQRLEKIVHNVATPFTLSFRAEGEKSLKPTLKNLLAGKVE